MKAGTESKTKTRLAIGLVVVAVLMVGRTFLPSGSSELAQAPSAAPAKKSKPAEAESLDPRLRLDLLANSENVKYSSHGKNIFTGVPEPVAIPKAIMPPLRRQQMQNGPSPAVSNVFVPPPITLKFFGMSSGKGEKPRAFLSQGEDVWVAREGDVVNRKYRIVRISPREVEVEDLLNNNRQNIPLSQS